MRKCCLDVVTRTLQTSVNVRKGFGYIFFTPDASAQVNKFLSKWRVDPVKCPLRYCQKYSFPIIWGLVFLRWEGVVSLLQFQINVLLPGTRCYQQSWLLLSALQKRREMRWWVWVLGSRASKEKLSSSAEVRELRRRSSALLWLDGGQPPRAADCTALIHVRAEPVCVQGGGAGGLSAAVPSTALSLRNESVFSTPSQKRMDRSLWIYTTRNNSASSLQLRDKCVFNGVSYLFEEQQHQAASATLSWP